MVIEYIDWVGFRKESKERHLKSQAEEAEKQTRLRVSNQGKDSSDVGLVRFILGHYPPSAFLGMPEKSQDEMVDIIAVEHGFGFYRTQSVRKQVVNRFRNGQFK